MGVERDRGCGGGFRAGLVPEAHAQHQAAADTGCEFQDGAACKHTVTRMERAGQRRGLAL
jgi:hypothetical protein